MCLRGESWNSCWVDSTGVDRASPVRQRRWACIAYESGWSNPSEEKEEDGGLQISSFEAPALAQLLWKLIIHVQLYTSAQCSRTPSESAQRFLRHRGRTTDSNVTCWAFSNEVCVQFEFWLSFRCFSTLSFLRPSQVLSSHVPNLSALPLQRRQHSPRILTSIALKSFIPRSRMSCVTTNSASFCSKLILQRACAD